MTRPAAMALDPYLPKVWRVTGKAQETEDTATLRLEPPPGASPLRFAPGQFNMVYVFGRGDVPISISGDPAKPEELIHTVRFVGSVTRAFAEIEVGQFLGVRGPYGRGWPVEAARGKDLVIVAGGLGLAPLRPAILHALAHRADYRRLFILYGTRNPESLLFIEDIASWRSRFDVEFEVTVDQAGPDWHGNVGVILRLIKLADFDPANSLAFVCGPEIMMRLAAEDLAANGIAASDIYVSMERNMKCAVARCGHCQFGPHFACTDGPVFAYEVVAPLFGVAEV